MGWSIGYDSNWHRDIGYGVPAICDFPGCNKKIDRGLGYVCGDEPHGGDYGCELYFCPEHFEYRKPHGSDRNLQLCPRCYARKKPYDAKPDCKEWIKWKLTDSSWQDWRDRNRLEVIKMREQLLKK
jgi:hypothetical protein